MYLISPPKNGGRHLVRLVADHEVPAAIGRLELLLHILVARELVEAGDDEVGFQEPVAGARGFELVVGEDLERQVEAAVELVLPLLGQAARADDQAALQVAAGDQLLDEQARHDGLAGAGIVGEQEAQRLARQHGLVDGRDLVRQRLDDRGVDRQHRVEQVREADALRLGDEAEQRAVAVEAPRPALLHELEARLVVAIEQLVRHLAGGRLVGELERLGAEPLHADDDHDRVGDDPPHRCTWLKLFELDHASRPSAVKQSCGFRLGRSSDPVNRVPAKSRLPALVQSRKRPQLARLPEKVPAQSGRHTWEWRSPSRRPREPPNRAALATHGARMISPYECGTSPRVISIRPSSVMAALIADRIPVAGSGASSLRRDPWVWRHP